MFIYVKKNNNTNYLVLLGLIYFNLFFSGCSLFVHNDALEEKFSFYSNSLNSVSYVLVYYPEEYDENTPVIYLLNGWGASPHAWGTGVDLLNESANRNIIFVSLSAGENLYINYGSGKNFKDYVIEVVDKVEEEYQLLTDPNNRGLCGISNGGGGAIYLLSEFPEKFIACGSLSGTYYLILSKFENLSDGAIRIDVGRDDMNVITELKELHLKLSDLRIAHEYFEHSGAHNWEFWSKYYTNQFEFIGNQFIY